MYVVWYCVCRTGGNGGGGETGPGQSAGACMHPASEREGRSRTARFFMRSRLSLNARSFAKNDRITSQVGGFNTLQQGAPPYQCDRTALAPDRTAHSSTYTAHSPTPVCARPSQNRMSLNILDMADMIDETETVNINTGAPKLNPGNVF